MQNQTYNVVSHALLGVSLHLLVLNEMQLRCRQAIEYCMLYNCSLDCKTSHQLQGQLGASEQHQLACVSAALSIQHGAMHHKTDHPSNCSQHCCDGLWLCKCSGSCNLQQLMHPTCIIGSRQRSPGTGTCQQGGCGGGQAAHQGLWSTGHCSNCRPPWRTPQQTCCRAAAAGTAGSAWWAL